MAGQSWVFGSHHAHFEDPDILWVTFSGTTGLEDTQKVVDICRGLAQRGQPLYLACEVKNAILLNDARHYLIQNMKLEWFRYAVYIGAGFAQRTMTKAISLALMVMGRRDFRLVFVDTVEAARQFIERDRSSQDSQASGMA